MNYLWVSIVLYFGLTAQFAIVAAGGTTFYILTRFIGVALYMTQVIFLNSCLECCSSMFCFCFCCRVLGRACGRSICACCFRCAGPEPELPVVGEDDDGDSIKTGMSANLDDAERGRTAQSRGESKNAPQQRRRRASVVDFGADAAIATNVEDVRGERDGDEDDDDDEAGAEFMDAHEGATSA